MPGDPAYEIQTADRLLAVINGGDDAGEATRQYRMINTVLADFVEQHGGKHKAELVLKFSFTIDPRGTDVSLDITSKLPKRPVVKERLFVDRSRGVLTLQDPARDSLFPGSDLGRRRAEVSNG